jgi:bifunctional non-homologous end joining protein LigD
MTRATLDEYHRRRDFGRTPEPDGSARPKGRKPRSRASLEFVVQKHAASHLHFDFRLELDGVMKSWAVPKGPSVDPSVRRLAMETEDHPMAYNAFEGIIPKGEYGGGTVMIWDRGRYHADEAAPGDDERVLRRAYGKGKLSFTLEGERLRGSWALIRTRGRDGGSTRSWLLLKHDDAHAVEGHDIVAEHVTSVVSGRTLEEIATGGSAVWHSNRGASKRSLPGRKRAAAKRSRAKPVRTGVRTAAARPEEPTIRPMLAAPARTLPDGDGWSYEPHPGGTRALAYITPDAVRLITGAGTDRTAHQPDIARELARLPGRNRRSFVLDAELVAPRGEPARLHVADLLLEDGEPLLDLPWQERRERLRKLYSRRRQAHVLLVPTYDDAAAAAEAAARDGLKAIVAKRRDSPYRPGRRTRDWLRIPSPGG